MGADVETAGWLGDTQGSTDNLNKSAFLSYANFQAFPSAASMPNKIKAIDRATGDIYYNNSGTWLLLAGLPSGTIQMWAGNYNAIPSGWLGCYGQAVSRTTYASLFAALGTKFGAGDGSTTFNLPDLRAKFPRGAPNITNPGGTGGADSVTLSVNELPSHTHTVNDPGHAHLFRVAGGSGSDNRVTLSTGTFQNVSGQVQSNTTGITIANTGSGQAHENRPAFLELVYIIKV
jgi:microcystin-dependent protein